MINLQVNERVRTHLKTKLVQSYKYKKLYNNNDYNKKKNVKEQVNHNIIIYNTCESNPMQNPFDVY